ncbi:hypothetical protein I4U23_025284 [Adineta vaga]|nr:hypothetical protein I4U23_025284 [Adineta vaga]
MVGFDTRTINTFDTQFICQKCVLILHDPVQLTECGHRLCKSCVDIQEQYIFFDHIILLAFILLFRTMITCPVCHTQTPTHLIRLDRGFKREMESLSIECFLCPWTGILKNYQPHLDELHSHPTCQYCNLPFNSVSKLSEHQLLQCQQVTTNCLLKDFGCDQQVSTYCYFLSFSLERRLF